MTTATTNQQHLRDQIAHAARRLTEARQDGGYKQIRFWLDRRELLLDRLHMMNQREVRDDAP